ncbi:hypothetical protein SNL152K_10708 [Streptomyces sp. NL15-2K]|nr:hypothetical protein SNL152K_10708 [Streptomyces sp. NL15-2K]
MPRHRPRRRQLLHQPLERHILMSKSPQARLPHPPQHSTELRITRQIRPDHQRIQEETDQIVQRLIRTTRHRRTHRNVRPGPDPRQRHRQRGLQHHEHRHTLGTGQFRQPPVHLRRHPHRHPMPLMTRHHRTRPVHRQRQLLRRTSEHPPPVLHLPRQQALRVRLLPQQLPLPQRIIRVLHRQRLPHRTLTTHPRRIRRRQVPTQRPHRQTITGDVMHHHHQHLLLAARTRHLEQPHPDRQLHRQVEGVLHRLAHGVSQVLGLDRGGLQLPVHVPRVEDVLIRLPVLRQEDRPQRLVPGDHVPERLLQHHGVHTAQPDPDRDVVRRARALQLRQEPQSPLRERQRHPLRTRRRHPQRDTPQASRLLGEPGRQGRHRGRLEQRPDLDLDAQCRTYPRSQPDREQRMPAQCEEAVVDAHRVQPQHLGEDRAQDLFLGRGGAAARARRVFRCGQGTAVQLAVDGQREFCEFHDRGRDHVLGQAPRHEVTHVVRVDSAAEVAVVLDWYDVGHQPLLTRGVLAGQYGGLPHVRVGQQQRLDLAGFDPEAADLHLLVHPAEEHEPPVGRPLHQVAGAVHARTAGPVGAGHEPLGRQPRTTHVAARHARAGDVQLTGNPDRHRVEHAVQRVEARVGDGSTDRRFVAGGQRRRHRGAYGRLRRTVRVDEVPFRRRPPCDEARVQCLAGRHQRGHRREFARVQGAEDDRGEGRVGHAVARHDLCEPAIRKQFVRRGRHQGRSGAEGHDHFPRGGVEADRGELEHPRVPAHRQPLTLGRHQVDRTGMGDRHTLRRPCRPGRVDHIRHPGRMDRHIGRRGGGVGVQQGDRHRIVEGDQRHAPDRQILQGVLGPEHQLRAAAGQHERHSIHRQPPVDGQVCRAGLPHGQDRRHQLRTTRQAQSDHRFGAHAPAAQVVRESIRRRVHLAIRQLRAVGDDCHGIRRVRHPPVEQLDNRRAGHLDRRVVPSAQQRVTLVGAEHVHGVERDVRAAVQRADERTNEVFRRGGHQPDDRPRIEQGDRLHAEAQTVHASIADRRRHRIVGPVLDDDPLDAFDRPPPVRLATGRALRTTVDMAVVEQRREQGCVARDTARALRHRERRVLVLQQRREPVPHALDRGAHPRPAGLHAHREGVHERAHDTVGARTGVHPTEQDRAEHHVLTARQRGQHPRPHHMQHRRGADAQLPRHPPQPLHDLVGDRRGRRDHTTAVATHVQQPVRGGRLGDIAQCFGEVPLVLLPGHGACLRHEVAERQRRRQPVRLAGQHRPQFIQQDVHAQVVLKQVVHPYDGQPAALRHLGHVQIHQRRTAQVHHKTGRGDQLVDALRRFSGVRLERVLDNGQFRVPPHHLDRLPQPFPHHARAVDVMPVHDLLECLRERLQPGAGVELHDSRGEIDVLALAGHEVVEEQAFLERGQRIDVGHVRRPALDGRHHPVDLRLRQLDQRQHVRGDVLRAAGRDQILGNLHRSDPRGLGQLGRGRRLEQRPHRNRHTPRPQPLDQRHRQQRMPTELEEVVVDTDPLHAQDLGEGRAQQLFLHRGRAPARTSGVLRRRQRPPVQLSVARQRQLGQHHHGGRDHVLRQPLRHEIVQTGGVGVRFGVGGDDVCDQAPVARGVLAGDDRGLRDVRVRE